MANKWMKKLREMDNAIDTSYNPFATVIRTPSPSVNFSFGKGGGLPRGFSAAFFGPPGGGKSLLLNGTIGQLHRDDPEAIAVKFDTEFREGVQLRPVDYDKWGIDGDRLITFQDNRPDIFDTMLYKIGAMLQEGAPIALIGIDSVNAIQGRRFVNQDTINTQQIGDEALTIQTGLKMILPLQRKYHVGLIMTAHVRAEMDALEQKRGNKTRMAASFGLQHHTEYFLYVERNRTVEGRKDLLGNAFESKLSAGISNDGDVVAHKIRTIMKKNSMGTAGRYGEFTVDYNKGIINVHEEVFQLGTKLGIVQRPNNKVYKYDGMEWNGKAAFLNAIKDHPEMSDKIVSELLKADAQGKLQELGDVLVAEEESAEE